jgi:tRNA modification GTPase
VLGAVLRAGARAAEPGEFSRRAFLNGRLDLAQAEAISDIVGARSQAALDVAQQQLAGALSAEVTGLRDSIAATLAHIEVNIDFSSEDVPSFDPAALAVEMDAARASLMALLRSFDQGRILRDGVRVALAGRTNAGKSSLFNALLREHRAIVTDVPGTTRDFLEEPANLGGVPVVLVDTAGLRETDEQVEREGIARTRARIAASDVVLCVFDRSRAPHEEDTQVLTAVLGRRTVAALNKCDLPAAEGWAEVAPGAIPVSAARGEGLDRLVAALLAAAGVEGAGTATAAIITRERHRDALARASDALERAAEAARTGLPYEIVAGELMLALEGLSDIVGVTTAEDILDRVFSEFCIGK